MPQPNKKQAVDRANDQDMTEQQPADDREQFLNLLNEGGFQAYVDQTNANVPKAVVAKPFESNYCVIFPHTGKFTCSICFSTIDCSKDVTRAEEETRTHNTKCCSLHPDNDCLVCRTRLTIETRREHMLSKGHTDKVKFVKTKKANGDNFAFYYTDKGSGQSKPVDNTPYKSMPWTDKDATCTAAFVNSFVKAEIYSFKITKSMAACKDKNVAALTNSSEVVNLLDTLCMFATIGVFPCPKCNDETDVSPEAILAAVKMGVPDVNKQKFFDTKLTKSACRLCQTVLTGFTDSMVVAATCKAMKKTILTAIKTVDDEKK